MAEATVLLSAMGAAARVGLHEFRSAAYIRWTVFAATCGGGHVAAGVFAFGRLNTSFGGLGFSWRCRHGFARRLGQGGDC